MSDTISVKDMMEAYEAEKDEFDFEDIEGSDVEVGEDGSEPEVAEDDSGFVNDDEPVDAEEAV